MNRFYLIIPVVLLALFGGLYWQHQVQRAAGAQVRAASAAAAQVAEQARKVAAERKARDEADQRIATRQAEEQKKLATARAQWSADSVRLATETAEAQAQVAQLRTELVTVEKQLNDARQARVAQATQAMELAREVELGRIAKRNAELEVQRTTEILARRAAQSSLVRGTP